MSTSKENDGSPGDFVSISRVDSSLERIIDVLTVRNKSRYEQDIKYRQAVDDLVKEIEATIGRAEQAMSTISEDVWQQFVTHAQLLETSTLEHIE